MGAREFLDVIRIIAVVWLLTSPVTDPSPSGSCRHLTTVYLDRVLNGPEIHQLGTAARLAREHFTEVRLKENHPNGTGESDTMESAQGKLRRAEQQLGAFQEETTAKFSSKLYSICAKEGKEKSAFGGLGVHVHLVTSTLLGVLDSIRGKLTAEEGPVVAVQHQLGSLLSYPSRFDAASLAVWGANAIGGGLVVIFLGATLLLISPVLHLYVLFYQYGWLVWGKCFLLETFLQPAFQANPSQSPETVALALLSEMDWKTGLFYYFYFFSVAGLFGALHASWFSRIFFSVSKRQK
jgi:hypothetical protein